MNIGLFFGSFNPIHIGHLAIANFFSVNSDLEEIWLVVSPQNPIKPTAGMIPLAHRLKMVEIAIHERLHYRVSDFEKELPIPSFTYNSLCFLRNKFPQHTFHLIIGGDNIEIFAKWRNYDQILDEFKVYAYPRPNCDATKFDHRISLFDAPNIDVSSSFIRQAISDGKNMQFFVPYGVYDYLISNNLDKYYTK